MKLAQMAPAAMLAGAICVFGDCPDAVMKSRSALAAQNFEAALKALEPCLKREPKNPAALVLKGNLTYMLGRDAEAVGIFENVISRNPENLDARYALGRVHYFNARYDAAREQMSYVTKTDPSNYRAWDNLGLALEGVGEIQAAIEAHLKAIVLVSKEHPEYDWAHANLAELLMKQNENRQAFDLAVEAATRNPNSARNFFLAGKALTRLDQWPKAERWLKQSVTLDPDYPEPYYLLGQLYRRDGRQEESEKALQAFKERKAKAPDKRR